MKNERVRYYNTNVFTANCKNRYDDSGQYKLGTIEHRPTQAKNYSTALGRMDLVNGIQPKHETSTHFIPRQDRQEQAEEVKLKKQGVQSVVLVLRKSIDIPLTLRVRG